MIDRQINNVFFHLESSSPFKMLTILPFRRSLKLKSTYYDFMLITDNIVNVDEDSSMLSADTKQNFLFWKRGGIQVKPGMERHFHHNTQVFNP